jgi:small-conductance mechanosensitive channel
MARLVFGVAMIMACFWVCAASAQQESPAVVKPGQEAALSPNAVTLDGVTLFTVKDRILSFTAEERAKAISGRLEKIARMPVFALDSLGVVHGETSSDIIVGDLIVMSVSDADARLEGVPREALAKDRLEKIRAAILNYRQQRSAQQLMSGGLYSLGATALLGLLLLLIRWGFRAGRKRIETQRGLLIRSIRFQNVEVFQEERIVAVLHAALRISRLIVVIILLDVYITFVLRQFPWTQEIAASLTGYVLAPLTNIAQGFLNYLPNVFFVAMTILVTYLVTKSVHFFFNEVGKGTITLGGFQREWAESSYKIVRFLIIAFCLVVIFPYLPGSDSPAFKGVSVFLGVLLSLGSSSAIANVVAGVILTYTGAFKLGDRVKIADTVGDVLEKTLLVTRVRTIKNVDITIPNSLVLSSHVINYSSSAQAFGLILNTTVTIGYDAPWRKVHGALLAAAKSTEHILPLPEPFVLQTALNDFYVSYELNAYTDKPHGMARTYSALHQNIQDRFNEAGIEIMSPHFSALRDGNQTTIPTDYLPEDYNPPSFRV